MSNRRPGRPAKAPDEARDKRIVIWVNRVERARFLSNAAEAGLNSSDFGRSQLCSDGTRPSRHGGSANDFELIDALTRIGMTLQQIAPIIAETREAPEDFEQILDRLDAVLDRVLPP